MNQRGFRTALKELGLGTSSKTTVRALGLSKSQIQRLAHGRQKVTQQTQNLLAMYAKHGIPKVLPGDR